MFLVMIRVTSCRSSLSRERLPAGPPPAAAAEADDCAVRVSRYSRVVLEMKVSVRDDIERRASARRLAARKVPCHRLTESPEGIRPCGLVDLLAIIGLKLFAELVEVGEGELARVRLFADAQVDDLEGDEVAVSARGTRRRAGRAVSWGSKPDAPDAPLHALQGIRPRLYRARRLALRREPPEDELGLLLVLAEILFGLRRRPGRGRRGGQRGTRNSGCGAAGHTFSSSTEAASGSPSDMRKMVVLSMIWAGRCA